MRLALLVAGLVVLATACTSAPRRVGPQALPIQIERVLQGMAAPPTSRQFAASAREVLGVRFVSPSTGFVVACVREGHACPRQIFRTGDGGRTWRKVRASEIPAQPDFVTTSLAYAAQGRCTAKRCRARLLRSTDGGRTWGIERRFEASAPTSMPDWATAVSFADPEHGWLAFAGGLLSTSDGGSSWARVPVRCPSRGPASLQAISLPTPDTGFVECEGEPATDMTEKALLRTDDAGTTWRVVSETALPPGHRSIGQIPIIGDFASLAFQSPSLGFLLADRLGVDKTTNGGRTFHQLVFTDDADAVTGVSWPAPSAGFVALAQGGLYETRDGGGTWSHIWPGPYPRPQSAVTFRDPEDGLGAGLGYNGVLGDPGAILSTSDGGTTWTERTSLTGVGVSSFSFGPGGTVVALGARPSTGSEVLLRSTDEGRTWTRVTMPSLFVDGLCSVTPETWFAAGRNQGTGPESVYRTDDAGASWARVAGGLGLSQLSFTSTADGWGIGTRSIAPSTPQGVFRTTNGGRIWTEARVPRDLSPHGIGFVDAKDGWIGAERCSELVLPSPTGPKRGWCGSRPQPVLLRTTDAGRTWDEIVLPQGPEYDDVSFVDARRGFSSGAFLGDPFLYRTDDGGVSWSIVGAP